MLYSGSRRYVTLKQISKYLSSGEGPKLVFIETNFVEQFRYPSWDEARDFRIEAFTARYDLERLSVTNVELTAPLLHALEELKCKNGLVLNGIRLDAENVAKAITFFKDKKKIDITGQLYTFERHLPIILSEFQGELSIYRTNLTSVNYLSFAILCCNLRVVSIQNVKFNSTLLEARVLKALEASSHIQYVQYGCRRRTPILVTNSVVTHPLRSRVFGVKIKNRTQEKMTLKPLINYSLREECGCMFDNLEINSWAKLKYFCTEISRDRNIEIFLQGNEENCVNLTSVPTIDLIHLVIAQLHIVPKTTGVKHSG